MASFGNAWVRVDRTQNPANCGMQSTSGCTPTLGPKLHLARSVSVWIMAQNLSFHVVENNHHLSCGDNSPCRARVRERRPPVVGRQAKWRLAFRRRVNPPDLVHVDWVDKGDPPKPLLGLVLPGNWTPGCQTKPICVCPLTFSLQWWRNYRKKYLATLHKRREEHRLEDSTMWSEKLKLQLYKYKVNKLNVALLEVLTSVVLYLVNQIDLEGSYKYVILS
jgi:hypothetical protein